VTSVASFRERIITDRKNADTAYRWNERLKRRVAAGVANMKLDAANDCFLGNPSIREETRVLLSAPPQVRSSQSSPIRMKSRQSRMSAP
jgi:hypothetical protein